MRREVLKMLIKNLVIWKRGEWAHEETDELRGLILRRETLRRIRVAMCLAVILCRTEGVTVSLIYITKSTIGESGEHKIVRTSIEWENHAK